MVDPTAAALALVRDYGFLAVALFAFLETSLLFPLLPSEVVVPFAAALLVTGPATLALFALAATAGGTVGSLFAYYVLGRPGGRLLERYGRYVHVSPAEVERGRRLFVRWGESSVLWGRLLPFVRSAVSIPAGGAGMDVRKFAVYTAAGTFLFAAATGWLVHVGGDSLWAALLDAVRAAVAAVGTAPLVAIAVAVVAAGVWWVVRR